MQRHGRNVSTGHLGRACRPPASSGPGSRSHMEYVPWYLTSPTSTGKTNKIKWRAMTCTGHPDRHLSPHSPHSPHSLFDRRNPQRQLGPFFSFACQERSTYSRGFDFHVLDRHRHLELERADEDKHESFHSARTQNEKDHPVLIRCVRDDYSTIATHSMTEKR